MLSDRIAAVDWDALPAPALRFPTRDPVAPLRALAAARNQVEVADAMSGLDSTSIMHGHMAAVFPVAVAAAPFLLEMAEQPDVFPLARRSALALLSDFMTLYPFAGFNRVGDTPLCCAVADLVRARRTFLASLGKHRRALIEETDGHWRFDVSETLAEGERLLAFGTLAGRLPAGPARGEEQRSRRIGTVSLEYPPVDESGEACLRLSGLAGVAHGAVLRPAECGEREH
ncbi:hypothetical protein ABT160_33360 [Streptomyces sp. NPDC001941]|uniref:hypothetical protein n=1 Tax=Streptomyces sp. NPDC001941 TaxID=3154659 RepID=UPI00332DEEC1